MEAKDFITWICIFIFAATGVITLLGIIRKVNIEPKFLNKLFLALILEIVSISVLGFRDVIIPDKQIKKQEQSWTVNSEIHYFDENGHPFNGDLKKLLLLTNASIAPERIETTCKNAGHLNFRINNDINKINLVFKCNDTTGLGWDEALIDDFSKDSRDVKISQKDSSNRTLSLIVNIKKTSYTQADQKGLTSNNSNGPPVTTK
jgi:hypothetical protein